MFSKRFGRVKKRRTVPERFFCRGVRMDRILRIFEQLVRRRYYIFDLGTRPGLKRRQSVDQYRRVRYQIGCLFQLGKRRPRRDASFKYRLGFDIDRWRQKRQILVRPVRRPVYCGCVYFLPFYRHICILC